MHLIDYGYVNAKDKALVEEFLGKNGRKKYILGINKLTKSVQKFIEVDGIIDDFSRVQRSRKKEVLRIEDVPTNAIILYTSTGSPQEVKKRLDTMGFASISYLALLKYSHLDLEPHPFMMDFKEDYIHNAMHYEEIYNLLADRESKETFNKLINFKISFDFVFMEGFRNRHETQYFDKEIVPPMREICFVDGGGYVGDTAAEVIKNYPDFKKIYLIEPIEENLRIARRTLSHHKNIAFINAGLGARKEVLLFNEEKSFSSIYGKGATSVTIERLDDLIEERVDYIKLDIEGAELDAINGASKIIKKHKPVLAICVYHKAEDWYRVPQKILAIHGDYKIYLRHYMEGIFESVMYFIPPVKNY